VAKAVANRIDTDSLNIDEEGSFVDEMQTGFMGK